MLLVNIEWPQGHVPWKLILWHSSYFIAARRQISQQKRAEFLPLFHYPFLPVYNIKPFNQSEKMRHYPCVIPAEKGCLFLWAGFVFLGTFSRIDFTHVILTEQACWIVKTKLVFSRGTNRAIPCRQSRLVLSVLVASRNTGLTLSRPLARPATYQLTKTGKSDL